MAQMKKILRYCTAVFLCVVLCSVVNAQEPDAEQISDNVYLSKNADYNQAVYDRFQKEKTERENAEYNFIEKALITARYFNNRYEGDKIDEDFHEDIEKMFPKLSQQGVVDAQKWIRRGVKFYRWAENKYNEIMKSLFSPKTPPILPDYEYELGEKKEYIDTGNPKEYIVITDIKKAISYSNNPKDKALIEAKRDFDNGIVREAPATVLAKLKKLWDEGKYFKLFFYGSDYAQDDYPTGEDAGEEREHIKVRLLSNYNGIIYPEKLKVVLDVILDNGYFVPAENSGKYTTPQISLDKSENLQSANAAFPLPQRFNHVTGKSMGIYAGNFFFPLELKIAENSDEIKIVADSAFELCNSVFECKKQKFHNTLSLDKSFSETTLVNNYISQSFNFYPVENAENISLEKAVAEKDSSKNEYIRLEFVVNEDVANFDVFVEDEKKTEFNAPLVAINGDEVTVRISPINETMRFEGNKIFVRAGLNNRYFLKKETTVIPASTFDPKAAKFTIAILLLGFLGGFLLNFMPCVLPVLSLKIMALRKLNNQSSQAIKKSFLFSGLGIIIGFLLLSAMLIVLKLLGYTLGWGLQFQNYAFLVLMSFICLFFLAQFWGIIEVSTPDFINKIISSTAGKENFSSIALGMFVVLMATPCSAPFLGTALGFALGSSVIHLFLIMMAVGFGLAMPHFLVILLPNVSVKVSKDEKEQKAAKAILSLMLLATIFWLLLILAAQIGNYSAVWFGICMLIIFALLKCRQIFIRQAKEDEEFANSRDETIRSIKAVMAVLIILPTFFAIKTAYDGHLQKSAEVKAENMVDLPKIREKTEQGKTVLLEIGAKWCLTCNLNNLTVLNDMTMNKMKDLYNLEIIKLDWSNYDAEILDFMAKYGRRGLPFYVVYSLSAPNGIVLPEILSIGEFEKILSGIGTRL